MTSLALWVHFDHGAAAVIAWNGSLYLHTESKTLGAEYNDSSFWSSLKTTVRIWFKFTEDSFFKMLKTGYMSPALKKQQDVQKWVRKVASSFFWRWGLSFYWLYMKPTRWRIDTANKMITPSRRIGHLKCLNRKFNRWNCHFWGGRVLLLRITRNRVPPDVGWWLLKPVSRRSVLYPRNNSLESSQISFKAAQ